VSSAQPVLWQQEDLVAELLQMQCNAKASAGTELTLGNRLAESQPRNSRTAPRISAEIEQPGELTGNHQRNSRTTSRADAKNVTLMSQEAALRTTSFTFTWQVMGTYTYLYIYI
jgi:hypothetical protein